jgi:hypothetical protein
LECGESEDNQNIRFEENKVRQKMGVLRERESGSCGSCVAGVNLTRLRVET